MILPKLTWLLLQYRKNNESAKNEKKNAIVMTLLVLRGKNMNKYGDNANSFVATWRGRWIFWRIWNSIVLAMVLRMIFSLLNFTTSTTNLDTMRFAFRIHYGFVLLFCAIFLHQSLQKIQWKNVVLFRTFI